MTVVKNYIEGLYNDETFEECEALDEGQEDRREEKI